MNKRCAILILLLLFAVFGIYESKADKAYRVLQVVEGDKFYIDFNDNGISDSDELIHIKDINTFPLKYTNKIEQYANNYDLTLKEAAALGFAAKEYTTYLLKNKYVFVKNLESYNCNYKYRFANVYLNDKDLGKLLVKKGLAFSYKSEKFNPYEGYESNLKIKNNAKAFAKLDVKVLDDKYKIYHNPECKKTLKIKEYSVVPLKLVPKDYKKCYYCLNQIKKYNEKNSLKYDKRSRQATFGDISIFLINPNEFNAPSGLCRTDTCKILVKSIDNSKTSIKFALYGIDNQNEVLNALLRAKRRGVEIQGVSDSYPDGRYYYKDTKKLYENFNVTQDSKNALMHNKFFIFDDKTVFTGTANISPTGTGGYNANTVLLINNSQVAGVYAKEFAQMHNGCFQKTKTITNEKNIKMSDGGYISIFFSPKGNIYTEAISPILKNAEKEIFVSIFYLTHKEIINDLLEAKRRGVDVRIIIDALGAQNYKTKINLLRSKGILVKVENWGGKNHEKNIVVDGRYLITGSANFSFSAMSKNDENLLVIDNKQLASFYREYFLNLYNSIENRYLNRFVRAESFESGNSCYDGIDNNFDGKKDSMDDGCKGLKR